MQHHMTANKKRGHPSKTKSAYERQPGEMPSPEKVRKSARVEENNEEEKIEFLMRPTREMRQFKDV